MRRHSLLLSVKLVLWKAPTRPLEFGVCSEWSLAPYKMHQSPQCGLAGSPEGANDGVLSLLVSGFLEFRLCLIKLFRL